jgi:hypothetical protein
VNHPTGSDAHERRIPPTFWEAHDRAAQRIGRSPATAADRPG